MRRVLGECGRVHWTHQGDRPCKRLISIRLDGRLYPHYCPTYPPTAGIAIKLHEFVDGSWVEHDLSGMASQERLDYCRKMINSPVIE